MYKEYMWDLKARGGYAAIPVQRTFIVDPWM